jgi:hypothetical protein
MDLAPGKKSVLYISISALTACALSEYQKPEKALEELSLIQREYEKEGRKQKVEPMQHR